MCLRNKGAIHYTQGASRWEGIHSHLRVAKGQFPRYADCSAMASWLLWNALTHALKDLTIADVVNGDHWQGGFTGTMVDHGHHIDHLKFVGDCAFYGSPPNFDHVTVYIGGGYVFSHGSEAGPFKLQPNYRNDLHAMRRYILAP